MCRGCESSYWQGKVTDGIILQYLELHSKREPSGAMRTSGFLWSHSF